MVLSTDLMCCNVVLVRSFSLAIARNIRLASTVRKSRAEVPDAIAKVIDPDLVMALAGAGSTLLFGPRQVSSLDEGGQRYSRICTEAIAIDGLHE